MLFNQLDRIAANEPAERLDFDGNDRMDCADVVLLFNTIGDPIVTPTPSPSTPTTTTTVPTTTVTTANPAPTPQVYTLAVTCLDVQNEWFSVRNTDASPVGMRGCTLSDESIHVFLPVVRARSRSDRDRPYRPWHEYGHRFLLGPRFVGLEQHGNQPR